ncbi:MAG: carbohydrate ABC transporter permease [Bacilli bacterium]|nr:carbohydrate ABC transporter permease [Mollicutes bacterium]MDY3899309.1 carbohydrate ABC transporter permease [Bacilli bacterium]
MYLFILGICLVLLVAYLSLKLVEKKPNKYRRRIINHIPENKQAVVGDTATEVIKREKVFRIIKRIICYTFLVFMAFCMIIPFYWMIATSLKTAAEIDLPTPTLIPGLGKYDLALSNYPEAITRLNAGRLIFNTIVVGVFSTIGTVVTTVMAAFAFSRIKFFGREIIFTLFLATMMIPGEMMVITNYITVTKTAKTIFGTSGIDTYWAMIVPFLISVYYIYLLRQNFKQIPNELYYAAKVDGTSDFKYLIKIMIPIAMPTIITITILKLMGSWNAYVWPMMVTRDKNMRLITTGLRSSFSDSEGRTAQGLQMAATTVVTLPLLFVFIFLRKYIMRGVSRSGIKG